MARYPNIVGYRPPLAFRDRRLAAKQQIFAVLGPVFTFARVRYSYSVYCLNSWPLQAGMLSRMTRKDRPTHAKPRIDRRTLPRTGRTALLGVRVTEAFPDYVRQLANRERCTIGALIENAVYKVYPRRAAKRPKDPSLS